MHGLFLFCKELFVPIEVHPDFANRNKLFMMRFKQFTQYIQLLVYIFLYITRMQPKHR